VEWRRRAWPESKSKAAEREAKVARGGGQVGERVADRFGGFSFWFGFGPMVKKKEQKIMAIMIRQINWNGGKFLRCTNEGKLS